MSLKPCRECGKKVSIEAMACPHCGVTAPTRTKSQDWSPCPHCGSSNTQKFGPGLIGFGSFCMGGCMLWIPVIGWVLAPLCFLLTLFFWIIAIIPTGSSSFHCQTCKKWFSIPKNQL